MLVENKLKTLQDFISTSTHEELIWVNGYLNGILARNDTKELPPVLKNNSVSKITIAYATETGNSKRLATEFAAKAKKQGIHAKVQGFDQYKLHDLPKEEYFLAIISTHGDGEPPLASRKFYDHLYQNGANLSKLKYSVLALGDSSYPLFCKAGEDLDDQLNKLGGNRIVPLQKCDVDYSTEAEEWLSRVFNSLKDSQISENVVLSPSPVKKAAGKKIYTGRIVSHVNLNDIGSLKETNHIEIEAEDVVYKPGDSLGIIPENKKEIVEKIIALAGIDPTENIDYKDELISVHDLLQKKLSIIHLPERVIRKYASLVQHDIPETKIDLLDLLKIFPVKDDKEFTSILKILEPISPRLYSIASSPEAHGGEVHITVAKNCFSVNGELKFGLASEFLALLNEDNELKFYIHPNHCFRLPEEDKSVIMIGPGTGIAPFRSFIAERDATGAAGKNWLFFGEQHFVSDFLYQAEIQSWFETGVLTKIDTAFSRDQQEKIYVQHKIKKNGSEFFEWLQAGSYVYVCGAKAPMSTDVEEAIVQVVEEFGDRTKEEAQKYVDDLKEGGRYLLDVY
jgi:sulfite reductase (NADPH) flavoprotein alpha-component